VFPHRRRLKRRKALDYERRLRRLAVGFAAGHVTAGQLTASVRGWVTHVRYGNTVGLRKAVLQRAFR
jgi:hypothetical protein